MYTSFIKEVGLTKWLSRTIIRQYHKRILRCDHEIYLPTGEKFLLPISSSFASEVYVTNSDVDWGSEALLFDLLENRGCLLDIGANIGYYSLYLLPKVTSVYCFEPDPRTIEFLKRNINQKTNISLIQKAVGEVDATMNFMLEKNGEVSHLISNGKRGANIIEVEVTAVDSFAKENCIEVEAIKIDAEGFDIQVLKGAISTLHCQRPLVLTEATLEPDLFDLVDRVDYSIFAFVCYENRKKEFLEIEHQGAKGFYTKMLFLVPKEQASVVFDRAKSLNIHGGRY